MAQAIKDNIKVYSRHAYDGLHMRKNIDSVFSHATKKPVQVHVSELSQDKEGNYHFNFQVTLVFSPDAASKASEIFWTLKLKNTTLSEDMLIESDAPNRNGKIDGVQEFKTWEREVCWYNEYKELITTAEHHSSDDEVEDKESDDQLPNEEEVNEAPLLSTDQHYMSAFNRKKRRNLVLSDDSLPLPTPTTLSAVALPAEEQATTPQALLSTAQANAIKITEFIPNILASLQAQAEIEQQKNAQIAQLQQQLANQEREQQVLKDQLEQELKNAQKEFSTLQTREQELAAEVTRLQDALTAAKSPERTPSPPPNNGDLQEKLDDANNAYRGLKGLYNKKRDELQKKTEQLAIAEKAIEDYKANLDQANQAVTQLKEGKTQLERKLQQAEIKQQTSAHNMDHLKRVNRSHLRFKAIFGSVKDHREVAEKQLAKEKTQTTQLTEELKKQEESLEAACQALAPAIRNEDRLKSQLQSTEQKLKEERTNNSSLKRKLERAQQQVTEKEKEANDQKRLRTETELKSQQQIQALSQQLQDKDQAEIKLKTDLEIMRRRWIQLQGLLNGTQHDN